jgi:hypothetical protein
VFTERAELLPGNRRWFLFSRNSEAGASTDAADESRQRGQLFDIVKIGRKRNVDGEVLAVWSKG